jgi:hypothetical protein
MEDTAHNEGGLGWLRSQWNEVSGFFDRAENYIDGKVDTVRDFFNEKAEMINPVNWLKNLCETIFGKETVHNVVHSVTDYFDGDGQEAFGSGTFLASLESWENELATEIAEENQADSTPPQPAAVTPQP